MMKKSIKKFEDIEAWQKARYLVKEVYVKTNKGIFAKDFALRNQMRRCALSVVSNIAEGFARRTDKEFIQFLYIAHGSLAELESQLYIALDLGYIDDEDFKFLYSSCIEISKMTMGFIKYLSKR